MTDADWENVRKKKDGAEKLFSTSSNFQSATDNGLTESNILWGTTAFIVDRGLDQVRTVIIVRVAKSVCRESNMGPFLAESCPLLGGTTGLAPSQIPSIPALRSAARSDLAGLPQRALTFAIGHTTFNPSVPAEMQRLDAALSARFGAAFVAELLAGRDPGVAFGKLAFLPAIPKVTLDLANHPAATRVYAIALVAASYGDDIRDVSQNLFSNAVAFRYAMKAYMINAAHQRPFQAWSGAAPAKACVVTSCIKAAQLAQAVMWRVDSIRQLANNAVGVADSHAGLVNATERAMQALRGTASALAGDDPAVARALVAFDGLERVAHALAAEDYAATVMSGLALLDSLDLRKPLPERAQRVLLFAADVAQATDANGVSAALDHFAAPPSSYLNKRAADGGTYWLVNAYLGVGGGREGACATLNGCKSDANYGAPYLPIGLEVGHPISSKRINWLFGSVGLFVQAIDLGTLASWRLNGNTDVSSAPEVGFGQVFAPGAHVVLGIRDLPLSVGVGMSAAPRLRAITLNGLDTGQRKNAIRTLSLFAAVDIPIFP